MTLGMTPCRGHRGCMRIMYMGYATDGCLYLVTILMGDRESLAGVGLIVSHRCCCIAEGSVRVL